MSTLVFWIDVDNTLLDNDRVKEEQNQFLLSELGPALTEHYWNLYEEVRKERGVVDIPLTLRRFREKTSQDELDAQTYQHVVSMFENYPFQQAVFPGVFETLQYLNTIGTVVIVSDGDLNYQAEKIFNSALADAVNGRVMLFVHKQEHIDEITKRYPADHYAIIDDKPRILVDVQHLMHDQTTTVFVKQGKYAKEAFPDGFVPDIAVEHIADLKNIPAEQFWHQKQGSR
ncbi:HAD family hydrolase [Dictyobacter aurantiacus]|uniref:Haloacid dehalogenase n=1 Tax=Dictyobacter aurantiacus TaxID=1936993 RepID=A0A401Z7G3_9CHLR|nr:hypothetical protein [Dictyobacter aurantiacus]GCE02793.1 hypothetical protein KDAU_01220 [Dictyobacter aurantiacus]